MAVIQSIYKHIRKLNTCAEQEFGTVVLKSLFRDCSFYTMDLNMFYGKYIKKKKQVSFITIRNRCLFTGRARAIIKRIHLGRHIYKKLSSGGALVGVFKANW